MVMKTAPGPCGKVKQYGQDRDLGNAEPYQSLQEGKNMYHDFESYTITRRSFLKGAGAVGAAGLLAAAALLPAPQPALRRLLPVQLLPARA